MSDTRVVFKIVISEEFLAFKMVLISTKCCIIEQQTTAINTLITAPIRFLQSGHLAFA